MTRTVPICRVLVVDDDPLSLKTAVHVLKSAGHTQVTAVDTARAGLALLARPDHAVDLILCDLNMPGMDGIEFLRQLAHQCFTGAVVLMSGENPQLLRISEGLARARNLTVLGALQKPVRLKTLTDLMARWRPAHALPKERTSQEAMAQDLEQALRNGEVFPVYQPQAEVATGRIVGVEALARWNSPTLGAVSPDRFVAMAEQHGLIDQLTDCILAAVLPQMQHWSRQGLRLRTSVNISMLSLRRLDFADEIIGRVAAAGIDPQALTLEVTEGRVMEDALICIDSLVRLRLRQVGLSIDDFGTRYASLSQLRDLPFTELKVDRSFVHDSATDAAGHAILESSIALGRSLGMTVVAEGVEDLDDWNRIAGLGCHVAQGYFISRPLPGSEVARWIGGWRLP